MNPNITANIPDRTKRSPILSPAAIPAIIANIPKNRKLTPSIVEASAVLKTGQIININPNIIESIPQI